MSRQVDVKALVSHIVRGDGVDKCRICMGDTTEGQVFLGDTVMMDGDKAVTLAELLEIITGVEVQEEQYCPKGACVTCASTALAAQEFRSFVQNSQKIWIKAVNGLSLLPLKMIPPIKSLCTFVNPSDISMQTVKNLGGGDTESVLTRLKTHISTKPAGRKPRSDRTGPPCSCPDCGKAFSSPHYLNIHLINSGQKEACTICGEVLYRGKSIQDHMRSAHKINLILCKDCPLLFSNATELGRHAKRCHKPGTLTCTDCGRNFPRKSSFEHHAQMHMVRTCRACGAQFTNRGCYRVHRSRCEPEAKGDTHALTRNQRSNLRDPATYTCDYCNKTYTSRPQLKNHIVWIHMDVRPHQCQWCGKRFYTPARLAEHTVVHTRVRNFECDVCGAKLVTKMAAIYHKRRHTGEKPYKCEDCGERFISSSQRTEHAKRKHNKGTKLQCPECPLSFVRKHELKKHKDKVHGISEMCVITKVN